MPTRSCLVLLVVMAALPLRAAVPGEGRALPAIDIIDDSGRVRSSSEWNGIPTILAPIYSRCPLACPMIAEGLKRAVSQSSANPSSYRVVLFSFDPRDKAEDLRRFREKHRIPLGWTVAAAKNGDARTMLDGIDYHYAEANGHFIHPNAVIALTPRLTTAKVLYGTSYDLDEALAIAGGKKDWIGRYGGWVLAVLLFLFLLSAVQLFTLLGNRERLRELKIEN